MRSSPTFCLCRGRKMAEYTDIGKMLFNATNIYGMSTAMYQVLREVRKWRKLSKCLKCKRRAKTDSQITVFLGRIWQRCTNKNMLLSKVWENLNQLRILECTLKRANCPSISQVFPKQPLKLSDLPDTNFLNQFRPNYSILRLLQSKIHEPS